MNWRRLAALAWMAYVLSAGGPAWAHRRDFAFTYEWWTPARGEKEVEAHYTASPGPGGFQAQVEFERGITERWSVAPYAVFEREGPGASTIHGWKLEQRYRFGDYAERKILPAAYLEVEKMNGEPYELEGKCILSRYSGKNALSLNLIALRPMQGHEPVRWGYSLGGSRAAGARLRVGAEIFGNFTEREHYAGPVVGIDVTPQMRLLVGGGVGLNHGSSGTIRLLTEYEWF